MKNLVAKRIYFAKHLSRKILICKCHIKSSYSRKEGIYFIYFLLCHIIFQPNLLSFHLLLTES